IELLRMGRMELSRRNQRVTSHKCSQIWSYEEWATFLAKHPIWSIESCTRAVQLDELLVQKQNSG
ncbi:MAG: hypothetical protein P4L50_00045, partial [Anaerolineaceae bacterium]|nr:hypothetical protein [Anaerolineaceae bacterium]